MVTDQQLKTMSTNLFSLKNFTYVVSIWYFSLLV